ncbi:UbiA family prenyltransferase [Akkermansiaceae bacterium]|nr:UbiA family prenyltransferase [Akkermansiaceae bacterium]
MRWWTYQKERFPLVANGILVAAFSSCALLYSSFLTQGPRPEAKMLLVAFVTCFLFFLQLRIADEFKDAEEDAQYRPYRAVPRGLVSLKELGLVFILGAVIQLTLSIWLSLPLTIILIVTWSYLALMSVEFFCRDWLKARPITYLWTHMLIMPLIDLFATAAYWGPTTGTPPSGLFWFLAASFTNGLVIELGRKIRFKEDEEEGVPTYSKLWGISKSSSVWIGCLFATAIFATVAASLLDTHLITSIILVFLAVVFTLLRKPGKRMETFSALWTLALYLTLGILPLFFS